MREQATSAIFFPPTAILDAVREIRQPVRILREPHCGRLTALLDGLPQPVTSPEWTLSGILPPVFPEWLGGRDFCETHRIRFPYVVGEMAKALTTTRMVIAAARAGFLGFFGAAGLSPERLEEAVDEISRELGEASWGANLIHSPDQPGLEEAVVDLYLRHGVRRVSASAFMQLTPAVVRYAATGLHLDVNGSVRRQNRLFAKVSRSEVAAQFLAPAPAAILEALVARGQLTRTEASLALRVPLAEDLTVEADSGGHTDNRPLTVVFPVIAALRDALTERHGYHRPIRLGAAGGLGSPASVAAAFALGAAYVLTGSVNQAAVESALGAEGKRLLADAGVADVTMAPSADMFELGVRVQVLKRGTLFAARAQRLYDLYLAHASLEALPREDRARLEADIFRAPLEQVWDETAQFWAQRDPAQLDRAAGNPKHRMALVFRSYLGQASRWAIDDVADRRSDFQIWCGPAIGAFNDWVRGSYLAKPEQRSVGQIGLNLLEGAAVHTRAHQLRSCGVPVPAAAFQFPPRPLA